MLIRSAIRSLRRDPGYTVTAIVTLAIAAGVNAAVFTVLDTILFKGFPLVARNDRIVYLAGDYACCVSYPDFEDWRAQAKSFTGMGAVADLKLTLAGEAGGAEKLDATLLTPGAFELLGQAPILGRDFTPADAKPGAAPVALLSHGLWERRYGRDPAVLGRTLRLNGGAATIIGVMREGFSFPQKVDLWMPLVPDANLQRREARGMWFAFGRLAEGATVQGARAEMETIGRRLAAAYPATNRDVIPRLRRFHEFFIGPNSALIYISMWGAVGFVLLIACANLANLTLSRSMSRSREFSVRLALGCGRWRIVRQLILESLMVAGLAGLAGWWVAKYSLRLYEAFAHPPAWFDHVLDYGLDYRALLYLLAVTGASGLLFGIAPALALSKLDFTRGKRLSGLLVTAEMAMAVVLLSGAGVMIRSFVNVYTADLGVKPERVLTALINLPRPSPFFDRLKERLEPLAGVESVSIADALPAHGALPLTYEAAGAAPVEERRRPQANALVIGPSYFQTLGTRLFAGRDFTSADLPVVIVNRRLADRTWPGEDPIGKRLRLFRQNVAGPWLTVVGVAPNIVQNNATRREFYPSIYLPHNQEPKTGMWVLVRTRADPGAFAAPFRSEVRALDPELPIWLGPFPLADRLAQISWARALQGGLFLVFAIIALLLASVGLYAVVAQSVTRRTHEIGIRLAIGATGRGIFGLVLQQGMAPLVAGLVIGLAASLAVNHILRAELVNVVPYDPLALTVAAIVLTASSALGCMLPARRATRVDPLIALRHE